ncbi:MAG: hypothetical protein KGZ80_09020 [Methylomonas sp.]|nr:hypothetical protein [Methylomonas sp.]PPD22872.1 MAG: hypothetical protein CTY23_00670 [Methylomonas sp.]PPD26415.1 MAG: hypothetical protein CTY22_05185 [Methylomonas sp.]PPD38164.1 MAG: hypothetical protein CTY21_05180 [Methylomonas sp.]PPD41848.1 MAG: hypothetical protein CTY17_02945 [Methylomonas sp.]
MKKSTLHKAVSAVLGLAALSAVSTQAQAFGGSTFNLGPFTGAELSANSTAPFKSWTDYGASNFGWVHTAAWATLRIGSASDIANGVTYDVILTIRGRGNASGNATTSTLDNPAFSLWTGGTNATTTNGHGFHQFNQVRGADSATNAALTTGGVLNSAQGWIGYANAGNGFTNGDGNVVGHGGVNASTSWLTNPAASSWSYSQLNQNNGSLALDFAQLTLMGLKSGHYLLALGGSCPSPTPEADCGRGQQFSFTVSQVPVPGAVWLFSTAGLGLAAMGRRRRKIAL